ncbi:MAG: TerB family tellurite resistance protein [Myxococcota bacterium]
MSDNAGSDGGMTPEVIDLFARGLYHLASVDGIEDKEEKLISEFLDESGAGISFASLKDSKFTPQEAALTLETTYLRRVFVRAAVALVKADGVFSDAERHAIGELADAFGMSNAEFGDLEQEASRAGL